MNTAKTGRPTKYNAEEHPRAAEDLARKGATLADIAEKLGVARSTLQSWLDAHPEFSVAIRAGRAETDDNVERSLLARAVGYDYKVTKPVVLSQGTGAGSRVELITYTAHAPPDVSACRLWLMNRRPSEWRDRQKLKHSGPTLEELLAEVSRDEKSGSGLV
jgi:hypothetical protein